ncbi:hypothetical protein BOS5A_210606 [Bosea sp. EC-HK365B]|nr:hypothetical protein BOSE7B_120468 [Bosea sp. 7B]CAD5277023.1 hypothetical protein BOSE21B_30444 [Bosea sp. 21B]VVT59815.1 hypothetical protein BOS5A_210606 [Bosea sp. EC-HK365B]
MRSWRHLMSALPNRASSAPQRINRVAMEIRVDRDKRRLDPRKTRLKSLSFIARFLFAFRCASQRVHFLSPDRAGFLAPDVFGPAERHGLGEEAGCPPGSAIDRGFDTVSGRAWLRQRPHEIGGFTNGTHKQHRALGMIFRFLGVKFRHLGNAFCFDQGVPRRRCPNEKT